MFRICTVVELGEQEEEEEDDDDDDDDEAEHEDEAVLADSWFWDVSFTRTDETNPSAEVAVEAGVTNRLRHLLQ